MNEIEISGKNDNDILNIVREYVQQGYQVFLQKRCDAKYIMSTEYNMAGVLDIDNSQILIQNTNGDDEFQKESEISQIKKNKLEQSDNCSINDQCEKLAVTLQKQQYLFSRDTLIFIPRQTITDFNNILSPQVKEQHDEKLGNLYKIFQKGMSCEQEGLVESAIKQFTDVITQIEEQIDEIYTTNLIYVIYVEALLVLGLLQSRISQYQLGKRNFEKCLRQFIIKDQILLAKIYIRVGQNCQQLFSYQKAVDYYVQALVIYEIYQLKSEISLALAYIGIAYAHLDHHEIAIQMGLKAISELQNIVSKDAFIMGQLYHAVGEIYYFHNDYVEAIEYFDSAYDIKVQYPKERLSQILTMNFIGCTCFQLGEFKKAQELYEISLSQISEKCTLIEAYVLNNLAMAKQAQNQNAKDLLDKAISIYLVYFQENHPSVKRAIRNLKLQK